MKKRFTDSDKWSDPWFRKLSAQAKLAWVWVLDNCDPAGVINPDWELAAFQIGDDVGEEVLAELKSRVEHLPGGKLFVPKFIAFQNLSEKKPVLSRACNAHNPIFASLKKHNLLDRLPEILPEGYDKGSDSLPEAFTKATGRRQGQGQGQGESSARPPTREELVAFAKEVPCTEECALAYQNDRAALNWTKVKSGLQVEIDDWRSDLRGFAMHWRANEAKRKAEGRSAPVARGVDTRPEKRMKL